MTLQLDPIDFSPENIARWCGEPAPRNISEHEAALRLRWLSSLSHSQRTSSPPARRWIEQKVVENRELVKSWREANDGRIPQVGISTALSDAAAIPPADVFSIALIPDTKFIPQNYVVHISAQRCCSCGSVHEHSQVYAFNNVEARNGFGKPILHLVPVQRFSYNVPVRVQRLPETTTPLCSECAISNPDLSSLPRPSSAEAYKRIISSAPITKMPTPQASKKPAAPKARNVEDLI